MAAAQPKLDLKMFVMPAMLLLSRKIQFTTPNPDYICEDDGTCPDVKIIPKELPNEDMIQKAQIALATVAIVLMSIYYLVYSKVNAKGKESDKDIWGPPKPKPTLPFGIGPAPEPVKLEDFTQTTLRQHEIGLVKESAQAMVFPIAIAFFMSIKMNVHVSLMMQGVMVPLNAFDSLVLKKYLLGSEAEYGELSAPPTPEIIKAMNDAAAAAAAPAAEEPPKVEELPDEPVKKEEEDKKKTSTNVKDID
jgi:hypothetical protein